MEHFHSDWTFKPITMLHVNAPTVMLMILNSISSQPGETHQIEKLMECS